MRRPNYWLSVFVHLLGGGTILVADDVDTLLELVELLSGSVVDPLDAVLHSVDDIVDLRGADILQTVGDGVAVGEDDVLNRELALSLDINIAYDAGAALELGVLHRGNDDAGEIGIVEEIEVM